jgi:surfeit locus 1 family protein
MMPPLNLGPYRFEPRLLTTLAAAAGIALTLTLGHWQTGRADHKQELQQRLDALSREPAIVVGGDMIDPADLLLRRVTVRGVFDDRHTVFLDNRIHAHQPGYHVATPLRLAGSDRYVLVNRGWVAAKPDRSLPSVPAPAGEQLVEGTALPYSDRFIELSTRIAEGQVWQNLGLERYRQATRLELQAFVIQQQSSAADGLVRDWPRPDLKRDTHLAYAFQWYALSLAILIYYLVTHVKRRPASQPQDRQP